MTSAVDNARQWCATYYASTTPQQMADAFAATRQWYALVQEEAQQGQQAAVSEVMRLLGDGAAIQSLAMDPVDLVMALPSERRPVGVNRATWSWSAYLELRGRAASADDRTLVKHVDRALIPAAEAAANAEFLIWVVENDCSERLRVLTAAEIALLTLARPLLVVPTTNRAHWIDLADNFLRLVRRLDVLNAGMSTDSTGRLIQAGAHIAYTTGFVEARVLEHEFATLRHGVGDLRHWRRRLAHLLRRADAWVATRAEPVLVIESRLTEKTKKFLTAREQRPMSDVAPKTVYNELRSVSGDVGLSSLELIEVGMAAISGRHLYDDLELRRSTWDNWALEQGRRATGSSNSLRELSGAVCTACGGWRRAGGLYCPGCGVPVAKPSESQRVAWA